jgi:hypothetical protein
MAGGAIAVPLATAALAAAADTVEGLKARVAELEDATAVRVLHERLIQHINAGAHAAPSSLFTASPKIGLDKSVRRLDTDLLGVPVEVTRAADGETATLRASCVVLSETSMKPDCTLVKMALSQGGGVLRRTERRVLENRCIKVDAVWKVAEVVLLPA